LKEARRFTPTGFALGPRLSIPRRLRLRVALAVVALIERTAANLGAPFQTPAELREAAAEIVARVDAMRQAGGLKQVNAEYKRYRQAQAAKAERATPYAVFLQRFTATIVRDVAATGRAI
jgi:hypothetical protein